VLLGGIEQPGEMIEVAFEVAVAVRELPEVEDEGLGAEGAR
jgi:hypothetical protein